MDKVGRITKQELRERHRFFGDVRRQGTLTPRNEEQVYIQYNSGACVWMTPLIADVAIKRGEAVRAVPPTESKKNR